MSGRVIAGLAKGRRLKLVPGDGTRPIMDRVKEALFSILGSGVYDSIWLDLFAGTGAVGIEALSRGAEYSLFVDTDRAAIQTILENLKTTGLAEQSRVLRTDAFTLLAASPQMQYDYIYVAPPQYKGLWQKTLALLEKNSAWIPEGCQVIVQIDPKEQAPVTLKQLVEVDERRYGNTLLWFFESVPPEPEAPEEN
ncbi:MAG: 16S rRNA (guanine(966)-N(2))-methyltransferase RsmD [Phototrophicaceae bacterium]|jgi:16S rRNA (guanine(966)-N(2))-methyltransferase RsmD